MDIKNNGWGDDAIKMQDVITLDTFKRDVYDVILGEDLFQPIPEATPFTNKAQCPDPIGL